MGVTKTLQAATGWLELGVADEALHELESLPMDIRAQREVLELKLAADLTKVDYLRNQTLPMFMLDYSYASLGRDTTSFGGAFSQAINGDYSDWSVGVRMEYPVSNELRVGLHLAIL